jgi:hypothetical protein
MQRVRRKAAEEDNPMQAGTDTRRRRVVLALATTVLLASSAAAAPKQPAAGSLVVRGAVARKIPGDPLRVYYATRRDQPVTFEVHGPTVLVLDVQPRRAGAATGSRFAVTLDAKDVGWVDVSCNPSTSRLVPDPGGEPCASVQRRFEVGKGKHRLAVRLVVGEIAVIVPHTEPIVAKNNDELDLAPIVGAAPATPAAEAPASSATPPAQVAAATPSRVEGGAGDLELAPIARPATAGADGKPGAAGTVASSTGAGSTPHPAEPPATEPASSPVSTPDLVALTPAAAGSGRDPRADLMLSPRAPESRFAFLARPLVFGPAAAGVVALGVAGFFGAQSRSSFQDATTPASQTAARTANDNGIRQAKTANVFFAVGGVALGAAAVVSILDLMAYPGDGQGGR